MRLSRRSLLRTTLAGAGAVVAGGTGVWLGDRYGVDPAASGSALAAFPVPDRRAASLAVVWSVRTERPWIALTFDDGPGPRWTPMVLDALDRWEAPATFFMVGRQLSAHAALVAHRLDRHEVGNHTWSHRDLARVDRATAATELVRCRDAIRRYLGREPTLMRPPMGHLGGAALFAAGDLGYTVTLWSEEMHERTYRDDPAGQVRYIVDAARPGSIILAHDVGGTQHLVTLRHLDAMIDGLRRRGLRPVTVSELLRSGTPATSPPAGGLPVTTPGR